MNPANEIHSQLFQLLIFFRSIHPSHLSYLLKFSQHPQNLNFSGEELIQFMQRTSPEQLLAVIQLSIQKMPEEQLQQQLNRINAVLPKDGLISLRTLVNLHQLELLFKTLTTPQLMIITEILPKNSTILHHQQILQQLQEFFSSLMAGTLKGIKTELDNTEVSGQLIYLQNILQLNTESWYLYDPLLKIFHLDLNELMSLQINLPKLIPLQMIHLIRMMMLEPSEILEMKKIIVPYQAPVQTVIQQDDDLLDLNDLEGTDLEGDFFPSIPSFTTDTDNKNDNFNGMDQSDDFNDPKDDFDLNFNQGVESSVTIRIVDQPPERCVYKRNLKPNPKIILEGDDKNHPNLEVTVKLVRCDTHKEMEDNFLSGPKNFKASVGLSIPFKKLKVNSTSHQQGETHFALKFELKEYTSETEYVILHSVQSIPFIVCSHSTQMKSTNTVLPVISQIIPPFGSSKGGTKVVVLGLNFLNTPCLRIKFDNTVVIPKFHGPKTLICQTPRHEPSVVQIKVTNDNHTFSKTDIKFTYRKENDLTVDEEPEDHHDGENQGNLIEDYDMDNFDGDEHAFDANFFSNEWNTNFSFSNNSNGMQNYNNTNNFSLEVNV